MRWIQSYSPGCANVHLHLVHPSWYPHHTDATSCWVTLSISTAGYVGHVLDWPFFSLKIATSHMVIWIPIWYMVPLAKLIPFPEWNLDWFSCFCAAHGREFLHITLGCPCSVLTLPLCLGDLDPCRIHGFLGPPESASPTASRLVQPFLLGSQSWQTDRLTDQPCYSICSNSPHLASAMLWSNKAG